MLGNPCRYSSSPLTVFEPVWLLWLLVLIIIPGSAVLGQSLRIEAGPAELPLNQRFSITVVAEGSTIKETTKFPDIEGFKKTGRSSQTTTSIIAGQSTNTQRIAQHYQPTVKGSFRLRPFSMRINGQSVDRAGMVINVGPPAVAAVTADSLPAPPPPSDLEEAAATKERAFLQLSTSKPSVYQGEGVHVVLYCYIAFADRYLYDFHEFGRQLPELIRQVKQPRVWEEYFEINDLDPETVQLNGVAYSRYKFYEAEFFPLTPDDLSFPALGLIMVKYKMLSKPDFFGFTRRAGLDTLTSRARVVEVKELPPHPLRDVVPVGYFRLHESTDRSKIKTGKGFHYSFEITGEGNIAALKAPQFYPSRALEVEPPDIQQQLFRGGSRVIGSKQFRYYITPQEPGLTDLGKLVEWVYFNPGLARYDTLRSTLKLRITGASQDNERIAEYGMSGLYERIPTDDNELLSLTAYDQTRLYANIALAVMGCAAIIIYLRKS